ncbi:MAG: hypothetical protein EHM74_08375 [Hyphomicrobiales bacterium]|nr:MAG: hypothetical protein EHM74_08375 [Hyphomicrobiales bacterium]
MSAVAVTYDFLSPDRPTGKTGATARAHALLREAIVSLELKPGDPLDKQANCREARRLALSGR